MKTEVDRPHDQGVTGNAIGGKDAGTGLASGTVERLTTGAANWEEVNSA